MSVLETQGLTRRFADLTAVDKAMLHRPPVLFLDEPTVGLDPVAREAGVSVHGLAPDLGVLIAALTVLVMIGAARYPRIAT